MNGKDKCKILKEIRAEIAANNDIEWVTSECQHQGDCKGTCPKCESEVRKLERELERKRRLGQNVAVAGVAAGIALATSACAVPSPIDVVESIFHKEEVIVLDGDVSQDIDGGLELIEDTEEFGVDDTECVTGTEDDLSGDVVQLEGEVEAD